MQCNSSSELATRRWTAYIRSYLVDRVQFVKMDQHQSDKFALDVGVPQGSVLGPLIVVSINHQLDELDEVTNAAQLMQCCKAARHRLTHVSAHHQVGVDEDAKVAYRGHRGDGR